MNNFWERLNIFSRNEEEEQEPNNEASLASDTPATNSIEPQSEQLGTDSESNLEDSGNSEKTILEESENVSRITKNAPEREETAFSSHAEPQLESIEDSSESAGDSNLEQQSNLEIDEDETPEEPIEIPHDVSSSSVDPLEIEEPIGTSNTQGNSTAQEPKNIHKTYGDKLRDWGITGIDFMDDLKSVMCVAIGGGQKHEYKADKKIKKAFFEATEELLKTTEIKPPTPMQVFLMALAAMTLPSLGLAGYRRFLAPKMEEVIEEVPQQNQVEHTASQAPSDQVGYAHTKEVKEGRTRFKVFSNGKYQHDEKGDYIGIEDSYETPSPEIQKLIDEGLSSAEIKATVYGQK